MNLIELGKNICNVRRSLNMTQEDVAFELDISITAYAKIERGETNVSFLRLLQIANLFKTSVAKLVADPNDEKLVNEDILMGIKDINKEIALLMSFIKEKFRDS